jgi:O-antigen chain-terminating methyltransferase
MESESDEIRAIVADLQDIIHRHHEGALQKKRNLQEDSLAKVDKLKYVESHLPIGWPKLPKGIISKLAVYAKKVVRRLLRWYINPIVDQQNAYNAAVTRALATLDQQQKQIEQRLETKLVQIRQAQVQKEKNLQNNQRLLQETRQSLLEIQQLKEEFAMRLRRLELWQQRERSQVLESQPTSTSSPDVDYFLLGAKYRNPQQMTPFLQDYDELFVALQKSQQQGDGPTGPVLDIGCGRGEFVAHLNSLGLSAYGIDIDHDVIEMGQKIQRDVRKADAFRHLSNLSDGTLAAVTLIQVIEHFEIADLLRLFRLIFDKLAKDGFILAETINPTCILALSNWFLLDPSHRTPLHPQMTKFLMEQARFGNVNIRFLHPVPEGGRLSLLPTRKDAPDLHLWTERINHNFERLNEFLYGPQDYAATAYKIDHNAHKANVDDSIPTVKE